MNHVYDQVTKQAHTFFKPSRSPFSAKAISSDTYVSGPGSIPAPFITVRMFWALSMSLHQWQIVAGVNFPVISWLKFINAVKTKDFVTHPARAWPVTRELKTASVMGKSLLFMKPSMVLKTKPRRNREKDQNIWVDQNKVSVASWAEQSQLTQLPRYHHFGSRLQWVFGRWPVNTNKRMKWLVFSKEIWKLYLRNHYDKLQASAESFVYAPLAGLRFVLYYIPDCSTHSVGLDISCFHLGQVISGGELVFILQVNL